MRLTGHLLSVYSVANVRFKTNTWKLHSKERIVVAWTSVVGRHGAYRLEANHEIIPCTSPNASCYKWIHHED